MKLPLDLDFLQTQVDEALEQIHLAETNCDLANIRAWKKTLENCKARFRELTEALPEDEAKRLYAEIFHVATDPQEKRLTAFAEKVHKAAENARRGLIHSRVTSWQVHAFQLELTQLEEEFREMVADFNPGEANFCYQQIFEPYKQPLAQALRVARRCVGQEVDEDECRASHHQKSMVQQAFDQLLALQARAQARGQR